MHDVILGIIELINSKWIIVTCILLIDLENKLDWFCV